MIHTRNSIYSATGVNISWTLIIVSTVIAYGLYWHGWQLNERIVNGIFNYGYPASLIVSVLIYGCYHEQCIINNTIFVETYGYFHWRKRLSANIADIDIVNIISEPIVNGNYEKTNNSSKYVRFKFKDGTLSEGFTLCNQAKMLNEIRKINSHISVVITNDDKING